ncbi:MAG TPA: ComEC/Rec2 family competence protein [Pyrinomonadaceae bacterium]|jgi:competence protein ComEC
MRAGPLQPSFASYPLAILAASFAPGILAARFLPLPLHLYLWSGAACALLTAYCFAGQRRATASLLLTLSFFFAGATLSIIEGSSVQADRVQRFYDEGLIASGDPVELTGVIADQPEPAPDSFYLRVRVERLRYKDEEHAASGEVLLFAPVSGAAARTEYEALELRYGARVRVMAALGRTESFRNPGGSSRTEYLERKGFDATGAIKSPLLVERLDDEPVFLPLAWLYEWRQRLLASIGEKFSAETGGVLKAVLLGNRYYLSRASAERFRQGGTFHVLVISGLHISFLGGLILALARLLTKRRAWQFAVSAVMLWAYALAVGAESSVVRAALMFTMVALAPVLERRASALNALGGAALVLLVWRPRDLLDPSFQLTFLSVLAIIVIAWPLLQSLREAGAWRPTRETPYPPTCPRLWRRLAEALFWSERDWRRELARSNYSYRLFKTPLASRLESLRVQRLLRYGFSAVVISASVQAVLLPLLVLYFHRLSVASLLLNIMVGVLMALLSLVALAALLLSQLSALLAAPFITLAEGINWLMVHSVDPFERLGIAALRLPEYTGWAALIYLFYFLPLAVLAFALARWNPLGHPSSNDSDKRAAKFLRPRRAAIAFVAALLLVVAHPLSAPRPDGRLRIDFLDVGQGDAALITMTDGTTLLVDGGGRPRFDGPRGQKGEAAADAFERDTRSIGEAVVSEYLWWRGLDHVDYLLATHADADHIDGLNDVARDFRVRAALVARAPSDEPEFTRFARTAQRYGVPLRLIGRGDLLRFGPVEAEVLWPTPDGNSSATWRNNDSIVLRLRLGRRVFLLTGDIERETEAALLKEQADLRCDVLKVAHHGSQTSSTEGFVAAARPGLAIISVGLSSPFGHPHREVLERWRASGAEILITGRHGTITISTDGQDLKTETFVK